MLPNFIVIGAPKAASTWLSDNLGQHPDVFVSEVKEINFFGWYFDKGLAWYEEHFKNWSGEKAVGEATPGYLSDRDAPARIRETLGDIKLIASFRHPVDRAFSAFWHFSRKGKIPLGEDFRSHFSHQRIQDVGRYIVHLHRYLEHFSRENILALIYEEDVANNPQRGARKCFQHLGVDPDFVPETLKQRSNKASDISILHTPGWAVRKAIRSLPDAIERPLVEAGKFAFELVPKQQKGYEPLDKNLRQELFTTYYLSEVKELEDFLGRDLSIWYDPPGQ